MYAVMGVTGQVGGAVARSLIEAGEKVRAIVREAAKGEFWWRQGCEIAIADLADPQSLTEAFKNVRGVFAMLPPVFDPSPGFPETRTMIGALHAALAAARPERTVALSTIGSRAPQPNLLNQLGLMEQTLAELDSSVAFLRGAWFMENAALDLASARHEGVIRSVLQPLDRPVPMIATEDVGGTAADLLRESWSGRRVVELESAARVTPNDVAAAFAKALGRPVHAEIFPREGWEAAFRDAGMRNPLPRIQMIDGFNEGWIDFADRGAGARKGATTIDQVIAKLVADA